MHKPFYIVAIGASAGGHDAFEEFFVNLSPKPGCAIVVVTHLLRDHKSHLPTILSRYTTMPVKRVVGGEEVKANEIYVMPENVIMQIRNKRLYLNARNPEEKINTTINTFFESLAVDCKDRAIAIILSGMGADGAEGALAIHRQGGIVLVQDPSTTVFNAMPWAAILKDHPQEVLRPSELAQHLRELINQKSYIQKN